MDRCRIFFVVLCIVGLSEACLARWTSGNEFALDYSESATETDRADIMREAAGRIFLFRYLQIMEIEERIDARGRPVIAVTAFEPSSLMDIAFEVTQRVSLSILRDDPPSKPGDAIAVSGRVGGADPHSNTIKLDPVIVRHKDRLSPAAGKEMLYEVQPGGVFYSFTEGPRPINLSYRDRDLLRHRERILDNQGPQAWFEFLERELAARQSKEAGPEESSDNGSAAALPAEADE